MQEEKKENLEPNIIKKESEKIAKDSILAVVFFLLGAFVLLSSLGSGGAAGDFVFRGLSFIFGWSSFILFLVFFLLGFYLWTDKGGRVGWLSLLSFLIMLFSFTSFTASIGIPMPGVVGGYLENFLSQNFGEILPSIFSLAIGLIAFIFIYEEKPKLSDASGQRLKKINSLVLRQGGKVSKNIFVSLFNLFKSLFKKSKKIIENNSFQGTVDVDLANTDLKEGDLHAELMNLLTKKEAEEALAALSLDSETNIRIEEKELIRAKAKSEEERLKSIEEESKPIVIEGEFIPPDFSLLNYDSGKSSAGDSKSKMNVIQKVLDQFNIPVEMGEVTVGPSVTQFTLKPAQGVNVRKILGLKDNLQMALSATNMYIEAPIPGKPFVGIEVPNEKKTMLGLRSILELPEFKEAPPLALAIGKNIIGAPIISDLSKMPHLLVAGATGTGKSVTLHNLILSLLYKNSPYDLKLIILDPKRVEFTAYNSLPHLYTPIIKDAKTAIKSLNWAAQEMDRRYDVLGEYGVPNISEYNKKIFLPALERAKKKNKEGDIVSGLPPKMPYTVIVFDEFNDFMLTYPKEITPVITSLSQKARAAGIHLILTTQRPDVKVITGTIKANIPSRIALKTTSQIDSRTILDQAGAEDLLGNGDMLYMNGSHITRVQAPFVSSEEINAVIKDIKKKYQDFMPDHISIEKIKISSSPIFGMREMEEGEKRNPTEEPTNDEDYMSAKDYVISTGKASTSALQTAFRWGYNKSARIMNDLETYNVIGPATSGRHREVLYGKEKESDVEKLERELKEMEEKKEDIKQ
ncbi:MAG: hypothetical protein RI945_126 [Candidatus Parcubacteria bacterium]|jgi:S-DNA-T family DNA segregation ATPase FtsK/SpoIIIE